MPFLDAPWLGGRKPKDFSPLIYTSSIKRKSEKCIKLNDFVGKIAMDENFTMAHLHQFIDLWVKVHEVHLFEDTDDDISGNLTTNGQYSARSAYKVQFIGPTSSFLHKTVWKVWTPLKAKFFSWLLTQNLIWTADRLQNGVGQIVAFVPLCKQTTESVSHRFI
jgi:hypothetical protein